MWSFIATQRTSNHCKRSLFARVNTRAQGGLTSDGVSRAEGQIW